MTYEFDMTPYNSVRLFINFKNEEEKIAFMMFPKGDYQRFESICIWGGHDKSEEKMLSWEFSTSLIPYIKEKYGMMPNCTLRVA